MMTSILEKIKSKNKKDDISFAFWRLDNKKPFPEACVTYLFYGLILGLMDKIVMMPFTQAENPTEASRNFLSLMKEYPPSLFIGLALLAVVAWGRVMAVWMKAAVLAASAGIGLFLSAGVSLCPLIYVVMQPVRDKKAEEIKSSTASPEKEEKE